MLFCFFPLLLLIFYVFNFCQFDYCVSWCVPLGFILPGTLYAFWTLLTFSFPMLGKFSAFVSSNIFSGAFSLLLWHPFNVNVSAFDVVPEVSGCLHFFSFFFLYSVLQQWFPSFCLLIHSSASVILLLIPSTVLFSSVCSLVLLDLW